MKHKKLFVAMAALMMAQAWADSAKEWGYWDSARTNSQASVSTSGAGTFALAVNSVDKSPDEPSGQHNQRHEVPVVAVGNFPTTIIQNISLPATTVANSADLPAPDKWFGYGALESGTPSGAYDDNAFLLVGSDWVYGTIPAVGGKTMTFRIAGEDMVSISSGTPTDYYSWRYNRDASNTGTSYVHVNQYISFPSTVPMTIGHWHKGSQTYYAIVGSATQLPDLQSLAAGPTLSYSGSSMGGSAVNISVNFSGSTWSGTWTAGSYSARMSGSASSTPSFNASGTVTGAKIVSTAITGVTGLDAAASTVKGTFYGNGGAVIGGLTVIKTNTAQASDLFVVCKSGVSGC